MMTMEEFFPTSLILRPSRELLADHVRKMKRKHGRRCAKSILRHAYWTGVIPCSPGRMKNLYGISSSL